MVPSAGAGAGVGEEKCSTSVSICVGLKRSTDSITVTFDINCKMFCLFFLRLDKVRRMAVEVASAGHRVVQ